MDDRGISLRNRAVRRLKRRRFVEHEIPGWRSAGSLSRFPRNPRSRLAQDSSSERGRLRACVWRNRPFLLVLAESFSLLIKSLYTTDMYSVADFASNLAWSCDFPRGSDRLRTNEVTPLLSRRRLFERWGYAQFSAERFSRVEILGSSDLFHLITPQPTGNVDGSSVWKKTSSFSALS